MVQEGLFAFNITVFKWCANIHLLKKMDTLSYIIVYCSLILTFVHELSLISDLLFHGIRDFQRLCEDVPMAMAFFMVTYEFYSIVRHKNDIECLIARLETTIGVHQPNFGKRKYRKSFMGKVVNKMDKFGMANVLCGILVAALWVLIPVAIQSGKVPFGTPWFPFDYREYYYYIWICHAYIGTIAAVDTINIHLFYGKIMAVICEQFDILGQLFQSIDQLGQMEGFGTLYIDDFIYERAIKCVKFHQQILVCCQDLQNCIGGILACQYCFGLNLCFAALATFSINIFSGAFINLLNHMLLELTELYLFCWFSSKLTECAENVKEAIFHSNWYTFSLKTQRLLEFTIMRCKKPVTIKAGNFLPVSIGSYVWILQQAYSAFMVLRQVRAKL